MKKVRQEKNNSYESASEDADDSSDSGDVTESSRPKAARRKATATSKKKGKNKGSPAARKVIVTDAEVHVDGDPSVKHLITKLSADMHMLCSSLSERIDKLESTLEQKISTKVAQILDRRVNMELGKIRKDIDERLSSFKDTLRTESDDEIEAINVKLQTSNQCSHGSKDTSRNVVIRGLPEHQNENLKDKVNTLISSGLKVNDVKVKEVERKATENSTRPGVVIANFKTVDDKKKIMASKSSLKNSRQYSNVFVENDQSREERLMARNFRTLVAAVTGGE